MLSLRTTAAILLATVAGTCWAATTSIAWAENPERLRLSSATKPLLLYFHEEGQVDCVRMQTWTFTDPRVIQAMDRVHPVRIELSAGPNQAEHFAVSAVPTLILITPTEEEVTRHEGRLTGDAFVAWLNQGLAHVEEPESENSPEPAEATPRQPTDRGSFLDSPVTLPIVPVSPLGTGDTIIDVRHRPPQFADAGQDLPIQVHVIGSADRAVFRHRTPGETVFHDVQMVKTTRDLFHCVVPGQHVTRMGVEYYITVIRDDMSVTIPAAGSGRPQRVGVR